MGAKDVKYFLLFLADLPLAQLKVLSSHFSRGQVAGLRETILNFLTGTLPVDGETTKKLKPYRHFLVQFAYGGVKRSELKRYCRVLRIILQLAKPSLQSL